MTAIRMVPTQDFYQYDGSDFSEIQTAIEADVNEFTVETTGADPIHVQVFGPGEFLAAEYDLNATDWVQKSEGGPGNPHTDAQVTANFVPLTELE